MLGFSLIFSHSGGPRGSVRDSKNGVFAMFGSLPFEPPALYESTASSAAICGGRIAGNRKRRSAAPNGAANLSALGNAQGKGYVAISIGPTGQPFGQHRGRSVGPLGRVNHIETISLGVAQGWENCRAFGPPSNESSAVTRLAIFRTQIDRTLFGRENAVMLDCTLAVECLLGGRNTASCVLEPETVRRYVHHRINWTFPNGHHDQHDHDSIQSQEAR